MSTRSETKQAERNIAIYRDKYISLFTMLYHNSISFDNIPDDLPKRYLLGKLMKNGGIAYAKDVNLYLPYVGMEINNYGLPEKYIVYGYKGFNRVYNKEDVIILRANDITYSISSFIYQQAEIVANYDIAILQNLDAIKTTALIKVDNKEALLSLANADYARRIGSSIVYANKNLNLENNLTSVSTGAEYLIDRLQEARGKVINETLSIIGIASSNTDKRERVQTTEVLASLGFAKDCISTLVDTFNYDAEVGGLEIRAKINTSILDYDVNTQSLKGVTNNEME